MLCLVIKNNVSRDVNSMGNIISVRSPQNFASILNADLPS